MLYRNNLNRFKSCLIKNFRNHPVCTIYRNDKKGSRWHREIDCGGNRLNKYRESILFERWNVWYSIKVTGCHWSAEICLAPPLWNKICRCDHCVKASIYYFAFFYLFVLIFRSNAPAICFLILPVSCQVVLYYNFPIFHKGKTWLWWLNSESLTTCC